MKQIPLSQGYFALVDDRDYPKVSGYKWRAAVMAKHRVYAARQVRRGGKRGALLYSTRYMHRLLLREPVGLFVRHKNGNGLDNQRSNLIIIPPQKANWGVCHKPPNRYSQFRGVSWSIEVRKWVGLIGCNYKLYNLGLYKTQEEAALAYDAAARKLFGELAQQNFPLST